jgi:pimeloyl-ACP methyl ester carboxylesterase
MNRHLVLLHGALGSKEQLLPFASCFSSQFKVHLFNFSGHGGKAFNQVFSIGAFADEIVLYLREQKIESVSIVGYSMGGYVALFLAYKYPEMVNKVITLGTKFHWDEEVANNEIKKLNPAIIEQKVPKFAELLMSRHSPNDWREVLDRTAQMMLNLGKNNAMKLADYGSITASVLCCIGDRDEMVSLKETLDVFTTLPNAGLLVIPNTTHPIERLNIEVFVSAAKQFLFG